MNKNDLKQIEKYFSESRKSKIFRNVENSFLFFRKNIFCFVHNFFETKYFSLDFFLRERSRSVDAKNGQTLDLTPSEHWDIVTWSLVHICTIPGAKGLKRDSVSISYLFFLPQKKFYFFENLQIFKIFKILSFLEILEILKKSKFQNFIFFENFKNLIFEKIYYFFFEIFKINVQKL